MKLLIKFPTRNRPSKFLEVLKLYVEKLNDKESTHILISCDVDDELMNSAEIKQKIINYSCQSLNPSNVKIMYADNTCKIEAVNANMENTDFDILLLASDDMVPVQYGYDSIIKNKMEQHYPDTDGVLWFNDGFQQSNCNTLCILGKKYYDRFNYIYNPEYKSLWCDVEFGEVAMMLNKCIYFNEIIIQHQHPAWGFGGNDELYNRNESYNSYDHEIYKKRKSMNFGF